MAKQIKNSGLVYSTETGRICPACSRPVAGCQCRTLCDKVKADGRVRISLATKGRKGKGVTLISGLPLDEIALKTLAKKLKLRCATGGTVKGGIIEIQGDHRELLLAELKTLGYGIK